MDASIYARMAEIDTGHWWFAARRRIVAALIEAQAPRAAGMRILEVGCGTGSNIALLQGYGTVDAVEPDDFARGFASDRSGVAVKGGYLPDGVALDDAHYDFIVLLDVLEHIPGDLDALAALRRKLAPGGRLMVTVPANPWMWSAHDAAHHHQRRYTAATLTDVFVRAGFRVRHRSHFNTLLFPLIVGVRALHRLTGKTGGDDDALPSPFVNRLLERVFAAERHLVARGTLPFGVSLALVAEPDSAAGAATTR